MVTLPRWRIWLLAARVPTLPAAVTPVLVGSAAAAGDGRFRLPVFLAALAASVLIQVGTNLANDLFDFKKGADTRARLGPVRVTQAGLLSEREVAAGVWVTFGAAALIGGYLVYVGGAPVLVIGLLAIAAGVLYTAGPWPLGYHGLGDLAAFAFFGVVAVTGTYYVHAGTVNGEAVVASLAVGLLVTAILVVNNLRDIETDQLAGKRTLAVRIGARLTRLQYAACVAGAYLVALALWRLGAVSERFWLLLLSAPLAWRMVRAVLGGASGPALNPVLKGTGQLELLFGALLAAGLLR